MSFMQIIALNYTNIFELDWFFDTNTVKPSFLHLPEFGSHQLIKLGIAWKLVDERHKGAADFEQALTCTDIRDITHLKVGDIKQFGKLNPIGGRLI